MITYLLRVIALAVAYYIGGRLGLLLLIPPGQATAFWPPSGIALAGLLVCGPKCWPGVFLGAMGTSLSHAQIIDMDALALAATIAGGATLQAVFGAVLAGRLVARPYVLERVRDIMKLIVVGGVVCCLVNASVATFALENAGFVPEGAFLSHWFTWWAGDVLGVVVFAPVMLLIFTRTPGAAGASVQRKVTVAVSMMIMFGAVVYLFTLAKGHYADSRQASFSQMAERVALQFEKELGVYMNTLVAIERFFTASEYVTADEYAEFTKEFFAQAPGFTGLSWIPKVPHERRDAFIRTIRDQGFPDFEIRRRFELGRLERSEDKPFYLPIAYIAPYGPNRVAQGFDVYGVDPLGEKIRHVALDAARDSGQPRATARFPIVQDEDRFGFLIYHPVYTDGDYTGGDGVQPRAERLKGYVGGVFVLPRLMRSVAEQALALNIHTVLHDSTAPPDKALLYDSRTPDNKAGPPESYMFGDLLMHKHQFDMAGRQWTVTFLENAGAVPGGLNWGLWAVALGGVLYCGLFGVFMLVVTARTAVVEREVAAKTGALHRANAELEEFAYRTSHDLRSPIVSSLALLDVASEAMEEMDCHTVEESLSHTKSSLKKLNQLIEDILQLTETANLEEAPGAVDFAVLLDESLEKLAHMDGAGRVRIERDLQHDAPLVVKRLRLRVILENLLSNAIKYQDHDKPESFIRISTREAGDDFVLEVTDNGLGIPKDQQENIFQMFKRFHPRTAFGSGLGLYLVQKSAHVLGGRIAFTDMGEGARFTLTIPGRPQT